MASRVLRLLDRMNDLGVGLGLGAVLAGLILLGKPWSFYVALPLIGLQGGLIFRARWQRRATLAVSQQWRETALKLEREFLHAKSRAEVLQDWETGLRNHRQLEAEWQRQTDRSRRRDEPFTLVLIDVHNLRAPASHLSPVAARSVAEALEGISHTENSVFRLGSSRFAILLRGVHAGSAADFIQRARFSLAVIREGEGTGYLRISAGVADWHEDIWTLDELLATAEADQHGRHTDPPSEEEQKALAG